MPTYDDDINVDDLDTDSIFFGNEEDLDGDLDDEEFLDPDDTDTIDEEEI